MSIGEFFGYLASILVFLTFYMKTMVPLRIVGILSNIAFLSYAIIDDLIPIMVLHALLLPLNVYRLNQIRSRVAAIHRRWKGDISLESLLPFMTQRSFHEGEVLFRKGDDSRDMFFILDGSIRFEEIGKTVGPGELFGEISMFSPNRQRTASAVCDTDGTLLQMSDQKVLELYDQNPTFGFYLVRLITGRLLENQSAVEADLSASAAGIASASLSRAIGESRGVPAPSEGRLRRLRVSTSPYFLGAVSVAAAALIYVGWSMAPYIESVLVREAAVTTWLRAAASPIKGNLYGTAMAPGRIVGEDGLIATVRNEQADKGDMERAAAEVARSQTRVKELAAYLDRIRRLEAEFRVRTEGYATNFRKVLTIEIDGWKRELGHLDHQLKLMRTLTERKVSLAKRGSASKSAADEARAEQEALERLRAERQRALGHAEERLNAAKEGVFLTGDGRVPEWAYRSRDELRIEVARATATLADAKADLEKARITATAARKTFEETSASPIVAPPGSMIWSVYAHNGQAVEVGDKIVDWIDCSVILVDVPSSDVEIPLLKPGTPANVVFEGDTMVRRAKVLMTRGGASTLGTQVLAAIAKGRGTGTGQAILTVDSGPKDAADCPVGRAAAVDFPSIDFIDLIRARLRM